MPAASFKYSNNPLHERGERGTPPSSPLRFGAFALGQQADMLLVRYAHFAQMPLPSFYFDGILPIDDRRRWHFAYPQDVRRRCIKR